MMTDEEIYKQEEEREEKEKIRRNRTAGEIIVDNNKMWIQYTERLETKIKDLTSKLEQIQLILNGGNHDS